MARLIKHPWVWAVVACIGLASWQLPPDAPKPPRPSTSSPLQQPRTAMDEAANALSGRMTALNDELRVLRVTDSLRSVMAQSGPLTIDLARRPVLPSDPVDANAAFFRARVREGIHRNIDREISELPGEQKMKVGVFAIPIWQGSHPGVGVSRYSGGGSVLLFTGDEPACVVTRTTDDRSQGIALQLASGPWRWYDEDESFATNILGPCRYYAAYGLPGAEVSKWMATGGAAFAMSPSGPNIVTPFDRRRLFGHRYPSVSLLPAVEACLAGRMSNCASVVMPRQALSGRGESASKSKADHPERVYSWRRYREAFDRFGGNESRLVADIESEFGPERFQAFWSSDEPMDVAFAASFGLPLGEWIHGWLEAQLTPDKLGPGLSLGTLIISLALISFCVSIVFAAARRRQVG